MGVGDRGVHSFFGKNFDGLQGQGALAPRVPEYRLKATLNRADDYLGTRA